MRKRTRRPSPALVISLIALFVALGGTGYAAVVINGKDIKNKSIAGKKLKDGAVSTKKLKNNAVTGPKVKAGTLDSSDFKAGTLLQGPAGPKGDTGATGDTGPSQVIFDDAPNVTLTGSAGRNTVASLSLPAGNWLVQAKLVVQDSTGGETDCFIRSGGVDRDSFYTVLSPSPNSYVESLYGVAAITLAATTTVNAECRDTSAPGGGAIVASPVLTATRVGTLTAQ